MSTDAFVGYGNSPTDIEEAVIVQSDGYPDVTGVALVEIMGRFGGREWGWEVLADHEWRYLDPNISDEEESNLGGRAEVIPGAGEAYTDRSYRARPSEVYEHNWAYVIMPDGIAVCYCGNGDRDWVIVPNAADAARHMKGITQENCSRLSRQQREVQANRQAPNPRFVSASARPGAVQMYSTSRLTNAPGRGTVAVMTKTARDPKVHRMPGGYGDFYRNGSFPLLPTGEKANPHTGENTLWDPSDKFLTNYEIVVLDVKTRSGAPAYRVINGLPGERGDVQVGDFMPAQHDQTQRNLTPNAGYQGAEIVGIRYPDGREEGIVPDKMLPLWVYK